MGPSIGQQGRGQQAGAGPAKLGWEQQAAVGRGGNSRAGAGPGREQHGQGKEQQGQGKEQQGQGQEQQAGVGPASRDRGS